MKRVFISLCLLTFVPAFALGQAAKSQAAQPDVKLRQELMALFESWQEARKRGDTEAMSRLMADEWMITNADGYLVTRERSLASAKAGRWKDRPISAKDNVTARAYGDTAVLTFRSKVEGGYHQTIQVWVKRQGRWQNLAGQSTKL